MSIAANALRSRLCKPCWAKSLNKRRYDESSTRHYLTFTIGFPCFVFVFCGGDARANTVAVAIAFAVSGRREDARQNQARASKPVRSRTAATVAARDDGFRYERPARHACARSFRRR